MVDRLQKSEELLSGVDVIHNTMAGAKKNLSDYNTYKSTEKRQIIALHLEMMGNFSQLQVRLANNKRPAFQPETDISPATLEARIKKLQAQESVEPKLYIELNRQIKLGETDTQHTTRSAKIAQWTERKLAYLNESLEVNSSAAAVKLLNQYDAFTKELASTKSSNFVELQKTGEYLAAEKYEHIDAVKERETNLATGFEGLSVKGNENKPILDDNFKREVFREDIMQKVDVHADIDSKLKAWVKEKHMLLDVPEKVDSVMDALVHLSSLDGLDKEVEDTSSGNLARLTELGTAIRAAEYSEISQWKYEDPDAVSGKETAMNADFDDLKAKSVEKRKVLEDGLAREKLKDQVGLWVLNHTNLFANFDRWAKDKTVYLAVLEEISNSQEAMSHLNVLDAFVTDKTAFENGTIAELLALGEKIRKTEYSSEYCQWCYEKPDEITAIETNATDILGVLVSGEKEKRNVLDDDLARELYAEETRLMAGRHVDKGLQCANWASLKVEYTESDIFVHSISEAQVGLSLLDSYEVEKKRFTATAVASLKELGQTVLARKYDTKYSNYVYENPDEIKTREADIDDYWAKLDQLSALRRTSLDMLLAREEKKEKMRIDFAGHAGDLMRYMEDKIEMIGSAEEQKIIFGFNLQEIESYDATLHTIDEDVGLTVSAKRNVCAGVVAEMKLLVNQTDEFDKAQAAKDEDPEEADEVSTDNTAVEFKRTRFTLSPKASRRPSHATRRRHRPEISSPTRKREMETTTNHGPRKSTRSRPSQCTRSQKRPTNSLRQLKCGEAITMPPWRSGVKTTPCARRSLSWLIQSTRTSSRWSMISLVPQALTRSSSHVSRSHSIL